MSAAVRRKTRAFRRAALGCRPTCRSEWPLPNHLPCLRRRCRARPTSFQDLQLSLAGHRQPRSQLRGAADAVRGTPNKSTVAPISAITEAKITPSADRLDRERDCKARRGRCSNSVSLPGALVTGSSGSGDLLQGSQLTPSPERAWSKLLVGSDQPCAVCQTCVLNDTQS